MKIFYFLFFILLTILTASDTFAANFKVEATSCDGCTSSQMKSAAESGWFSSSYSYKYVHIFDEVNAVYRKYKVYKNSGGLGPGEPGLEFLVAQEVTKESDINNAFIALVNQKREFVNAVDNSSVYLDYNGNIIDFDYANNASNSKLAESEMYKISSDAPVTCVANDVPETALSVQDFVMRSAARRAAFVVINRDLEATSTGRVQLVLARLTEFVSELQGSTNQVVSTVGLGLEIVNFNNFKIVTPDGGQITGGLDFGGQTFNPKKAFDGDCNDVPLTESETRDTHEHSTAGGAENMSQLYEFYGIPTSNRYQTCNRYVTACTGPAGQVTNCVRMCVESR